jgi:hypothetical protein
MAVNAIVPAVPYSHRPQLLLRGLDSLYVSYYLNLRGSRLDFEDLAFQREKLRQSRVDDFAPLTLGCERLALRPYGRKPYTFILGNEAFEIRLGEHIRPACHVQFLSDGLSLLGLDAAVGRLEAWFESLSLRTTKLEIIARADWAFDYHLPEVDFIPDHFVTRADKQGDWREHRLLQSVQLGTGDTVVRIYDKVAEIDQQSGKAWLYELWGRKSEVWRIEFQVRRDRLAEADIDTVSSLKELQGDLLRELASRHTSLRRPSEDSNRARWPLHPLWHALRDDIAGLPQTGLIRAIDPRAPLKWRRHHQLKALYGSLKGLAAIQTLLTEQHQPCSLEELLRALPALLKPHHNRLVWPLDVRRRITGYELGQW